MNYSIALCMPPGQSESYDFPSETVRLSDFGGSYLTHYINIPQTERSEEVLLIRFYRISFGIKFFQKNSLVGKGRLAKIA